MNEIKSVSIKNKNILHCQKLQTYVPTFNKMRKSVKKIEIAYFNFLKIQILNQLLGVYELKCDDEPKS